MTEARQLHLFPNPAQTNLQCWEAEKPEAVSYLVL